MWHCTFCIYFHSLTSKLKSFHFPTPAVIFLSARGTDFTWDLEKSIYGIFITNDDGRTQSMCSRGAEHPRWCHHSWLQSLPPLLVPQDQEVAIHAHWLHQKFKKWGGQGAAVVVKKVSASQCCLFLPIPLSFVYAKPPGARLCTRIASLSCGRKPRDLCIRIESLEELTAVFHHWDKGVNEPAPLFGQAYCKPWLETFFQCLLYFLAVMLWGLTQQQSVAFPALCFTPIHFCC